MRVIPDGLNKLPARLSLFAAILGLPMKLQMRKINGKRLDGRTEPHVKAD
jgi:hypothetical protein